jgi:hypothetical protein
MRASKFVKLAFAAGLVASGAAAPAQVGTIDPNNPPPPATGPAPAPAPAAEQPAPEYQPVDPGPQQASPDAAVPPSAAAPSAADRAAAEAETTVPRKDVFSAAEGVFGKGAKGLAQMIEKLLKDQGEPTAYITGREAGGAFVFGVRYGSGTLHHQIEGDRPVYWTGPSLGFDAGADANKVFVLVYNLHDSQRLYRRYPAAEGNAYVVGGLTASYLRRGDVVLIPVRMGVGARMGVNAGYMRFSEKNRWLPF